MKRETAFQSLPHLTVAIAMAMTVGCVEYPTDHVRGEPEFLGQSTPAAMVPVRTPYVRRVDLTLTVTGSFRPGEPIEVAIDAAANRRATDLNIHMAAPDVGLTSELVSRTGLLSRGERVSTGSTLFFQTPGYYRIIAHSRSTPPLGIAHEAEASDKPGLVVDVSSEIVWVLITETGGYSTAEFDLSVLKDYGIPTRGSSGAFREVSRTRLLPQGVIRDSDVVAQLRGHPPTVMNLRTPVGGRGPSPQVFVALDRTESSGRTVFTRTVAHHGEKEPAWGATAFSATTGAALTGQFRYENLDYFPTHLRPVPNGEVDAVCWGKSDPHAITYDLSTPVATYTDAAGGFVVQCPTGYEYIEGYVRLRNQYIYTAGPNNSAAGAFFSGFDNDHEDLIATTPYAARFFADLTHRIPMMFSFFDRSRGQMYSEVASSDPEFGPWYCPTSAYAECQDDDTIMTNGGAVFSLTGLFISLHEYAHGYHYYAVEPWGAYECTGGAHYWAIQDTLSCAFVEGFANLAAMWVAGDSIVTSPSGGDHGLENNLDGDGNPTNPPASPNDDGARVEASVAAFLYDLVDDANDANSDTNGTNGDDDGVSYPGVWLLQMMESCRLDGQPFNMSGIDQLVYCLEGSTGARAVADSIYGNTVWREYTSVSYDITPPNVDAAVVRRFWKFNLYGVGSLVP
jgi:hypothetical protein